MKRNPGIFARFRVVGVSLLTLVMATASAAAHTVAAWGENGSGQASVPVGLADVVAVAAGAHHTVALKADGTVVVWGGNARGQANVPAGLGGVVGVAAGETHTVALKSDGTVVAWGGNDHGQTSVPAELAGVRAVAAGGSHTVALKEDGTVVAWGLNLEGQASVPVGLGGVAAIAAGDSHTVVLKAGGGVVAWGSNLFGQVGGPSGAAGVAAVAAGRFHTVALKGDGTVVVWGLNASGQRATPAGLVGVAAIAAGAQHTVALRGDGTVAAWGANSESQTAVPAGLSRILGLACGWGHTVALTSAEPPILFSGDFRPKQYVETQIAEFRVEAHGPPSIAVRWQGSTDGGLTWADLANGGEISGVESDTLRVGSMSTGMNGGGFRLSASTPTGQRAFSQPVEVRVRSRGRIGTLVAWGDDSHGQTKGPTGVAGVVAVAASGWSTFALKQDGTVAAWGSMIPGLFEPPSPAVVPAGLSGVVAIAASRSDQAIALRRDGTVVSWRPGGEIFDGPSGVVAISMVGNGLQWMALKQDGTVVTWAGGVPAGLSDVVEIAAGFSHYVALKRDGTVVTWGDGRTQKTVPPGLAGVVGIAAGFYQTVALKQDGTVVTWWDGANDATAPAGLSNVVAVASGESHHVALRRDGAVVAWGNNHWGQCAPPAGLAGMVAVAAGGGHTVAIFEGEPGPIYYDYPQMRRVLESQRLALDVVFPFPISSPVAWEHSDDGGNTWVDLRNSSRVSGAQSESLRVEAASLALDGQRFRLRIEHQSKTILTPPILIRVIPLNWREGGVVVSSLKRMEIPAGLMDVVALKAGFHTVALRKDGTVVAWGLNNFGQAAVPAGLKDVVAIAVGDYHTLALKKDGTVVAWGQMHLGAATVPAGLKDVVAIAAARSSLALLQDGTVVSWGRVDNHTGLEVPVPSHLGSWRHGVVSVGISAGGYGRVFALSQDGAVNEWGWETGERPSVPPGMAGVVEVAAGGDHALALKADGTVAIWGMATWLPPGLTGVRPIAAGGEWSMAFRQDGSAVAWGLGDPIFGTPPQVFPVTFLPPGREVRAIAIGYDTQYRHGDPGVPEYQLAVVQAPIRREPSPAYWPERRLTVSLSSQPGRGALSHTVTERFPTNRLPGLEPALTNSAGVAVGYAMGGFSVAPEPGDISHGGRFADGIIHWGPFEDDEPRVLSYTLKVPAGWTNTIQLEAAFSEEHPGGGVWSSTHVGGIGPISANPADHAPAGDGRVGFEELLDYAAVWAESALWPVPPFYDPTGAYVNRAALIWRSGEYYKDIGGAAPGRWIPAPAPDGGALGEGGGPVVPAQAAVASRAIERQRVEAGIPFGVLITLPPGSLGGALMVEDRLPAGWVAQAVTEGGVFDTSQHAVKWGPFLGGVPGSVAYQVIPPPGVSGSFEFFGRVGLLKSVVQRVGGAGRVLAGGVRWAQAIEFPAIPETRVGDAPFLLSAFADSGLQVEFSSSDPQVATVQGAEVTVTGPGAAVITATQAGNEFYEPAEPVRQTLVARPLATPGSLQFSTALFSAGAGSTEARLGVERVEGGDGSASVNYATADGAALAGRDFVAAAGTLVWEAADTAPKFITIQLLDASLLAPSRSFTVALDSPGGGAMLGGISMVTVEIFGRLGPFQLEARRFGDLGGFLLKGSAGATYHVEFAETLNSPVWQPAGTLTLESVESSWIDTSSEGIPTRFYRAYAE